MESIEILRKQLAELECDVQEAYDNYSIATSFDQENAYFNRFIGLTAQQEAVEAEIKKLQEVQDQIDILIQAESISS